MANLWDDLEKEALNPRKPNAPGVISDISRATGQFVSGVGSTLRDLGAEQFGAGVERYGSDVVLRNPSQVKSFQDILDNPFTTLREAVSEVVPQVGLAIGGQLAGRAVGGLVGAPLGPLGVLAGQQVGGVVGGLLPIAAQTYGGIRSEQRAKGIEDIPRAIGATVPAALLERMGGAERIAGRIAGEGTQFLAREAGQRATPFVARQFARGGLEEAITEVPQSALERYGAYAPVTGPEATDEYAVAATKAFLGGGAIRGGLSAFAGQRPAPGEAIDLTGERPTAAEPMGPTPELVGPQLSGFEGPMPAVRELAGFDPYAAIEARAAAGQPMSQREQEQLLSSFFAAQQAGEQYTDLLAGRQRGLQAAQAVGERYQRMIGQRGDQLLQAQDVGLQARPIVAGLQTAADLEAARIAAAQQAGAGAQALPGMVAGAGTAGDFRRIMDPNVMQPIEPAPAAPAARTSLLPTQAPFSNIRMDRPGEVPMVEGPTSRLEDRPAAEAAAPVVSPPSGAPAVSPAAPAAAGGVLEKPMAPQEQRQLQALIDAADTADVGRALPASVQSGGAAKPTGKVTLTTQQLRNIRDALLKGKEAADPDTQRIVDALGYFADSYEKYVNAGRNLRRDVTRMETLKKPKAIDADQRVTELENKYAIATQQALAELGAAVGGNAKNIEAVVRLVKDMVQGKVVAPGKSRGDAIKALKSKDARLSQAWAAAKREVFMRAEPDLADVGGQPVRESFETKAAGAEQTTLERILSGYTPLSEQNRVKGQKNRNAAKRAKGEEVTAADVAAEQPRKEAELSGAGALLQYMMDYGTPMESQLAMALREAMSAQGNSVKVEFTDGTPRFDPANNTVYIRKEDSKEVSLHELFHAALQSFVYKNPNDPAVQQLKRSLKAVVNYKGELTGKAKDVQDLLKKLVADKKELDAVLELVSYGTTLNEFRRALQAMPTKGVPASFRQATTNLWRNIKNVVRRMLGTTDTVASDVLQASIDLLDRAQKQTPEAGLGNVLEAAVTSAQPVEPGTTMPANNAAIVAAPSGVLPSNEQLARYSKTMFPRFALTETLFNKLGWADWMSAADKKFVAPLSNWVQENTPALARSIAWVNSHYGLPTYAKADIVRHLTSMKDNRRGGTALFEKAHGYIASLPVDQARAYLQYMNDRFDFKRGLRPEPKFTGADTFSGAIADRVVDFAWKYMTEGAMDEKSRNIFVGRKVGDRWVGGIKFTEGFIFPKSVDQLASNSFGARNLRALKSTRTKSEVGTEAIRFRTDAQGDAILDDKFIGLYKQTPELQARLANGETLADIPPDEFISADLFSQATPLDDRGQAMIHDPAFTWDLEKKGKDGYKFAAHYDATEALKAKSTMDVANAFQNTMTLLANAYSTRQFADGLSDIGVVSRDENGAPAVRDGSSVVFDNLDQLNLALNSEGVGSEYKPQTDRTKWTRKITKESLINISANEARADAVQALFRNRAQWVRVPSNEQVYGALAGKIVNGSVWAAIQDASDRRPAVKVPYVESVMRFHKGSKTVWNPATWGTNVATNYAFALVDDIPMATIAHASKLYAAATLPPAVRRKLGISITPQEEQLMARILGSNALLGTFSSNEIKAGIYEAMRSNLEGPERNVASRLMQFAGVEKGRIETIEKLAGQGADKAKKLNDLMQEWYAAQDNVFRVASALNYIGKAADQGQKVTDELVNDAGRHARDAFLDYDIDAKAIRIMRQTAFPFISWPYAATKLVGRLAVHKPWKLVNLYAGYAILDAMLSAMSGDDEDELRAAMPEYMREKLLFGLGPNAYVRIPFMGDSDNPVYYHLGKYMFPSSLADSSPEGFAGLSWWPTSLTPTGPFVGTVMTLGAGVDPFTGNKLTDESASDFEAFAARAKAVQAQFVPNLPFVNAKETEKLMDAAAGRLDKTPNHASLMMARYMGLRFYDFNVDASLEQQDKAAAAIEKDYKMAISKLRQQQERLERPDWDAFYEREAELLKRLEQRIGKLRGEEPDEE